MNLSKQIRDFQRKYLASLEAMQAHLKVWNYPPLELSRSHETSTSNDGSGVSEAPLSHQHEYTVPVEWDYQQFAHPLSIANPASEKHVTKLRCNKCDSEVSRG